MPGSELKNPAYRTQQLALVWSQQADRADDVLKDVERKWYRLREGLREVKRKMAMLHARFAAKRLQYRRVRNAPHTAGHSLYSVYKSIHRIQVTSQKHMDRTVSSPG